MSKAIENIKSIATVIVGIIMFIVIGGIGVVLAFYGIANQLGIGQ